MTESPEKKDVSLQRRNRRRRGKDRICHCCGQAPPFCWTCRCGLAICQNCMAKNVSNLSCNGITWSCPDCGGQNGFGNQ
ncbi:MAG: hypothetical protein C4518_18270 [Desulfobacteraceae bacterium]|nr:MAG: hypothetical protein C4518_18270 [Desulfobacteraceae bacterium]